MPARSRLRTECRCLSVRRRNWRICCKGVPWQGVPEKARLSQEPRTFCSGCMLRKTAFRVNARIWRTILYFMTNSVKLHRSPEPWHWKWSLVFSEIPTGNCSQSGLSSMKALSTITATICWLRKPGSLSFLPLQKAISLRGNGSVWEGPSPQSPMGRLWCPGRVPCSNILCPP